MKTFQDFVEDLNSMMAGQNSMMATSNPMQAATQGTVQPQVNANQQPQQKQTNPQVNPMLQQQLNPNLIRSMQTVDKMMKTPGQMTMTHANKVMYSFNGVTGLTKQQIAQLVTLPPLTGIALTGKGLGFIFSK